MIDDRLRTKLLNALYAEERASGRSREDVTREFVQWFMRAQFWEPNGQYELRLERLEAYVFQDVEPNILPDIKPEGRGLEEYTVGISGTDETI